MEPCGPLPCLQESDTGPYPEPGESSPNPSRPISILSSQLHLSDGFSGFVTKTLY